MKKFIALLLTFSILFLLAGCDNVDENNSNTVYTSEYVTINDEEVKTQITDKVKKSLASSESDTDVDYRIETGALTEYIDTYTDANGNAYSYGRTSGRLLSFSDTYTANYKIRDDINENDKISKKEARQIAKDFLSQFIDMSKYTFQSGKDYSDSNFYQFSYIAKIGKYLTNDFIVINVYYDGKLCSFNAPNVGVFEGVTILEIDENELREKFEKEIAQEYPNSKWYFESEKNSNTELFDGICIDNEGKLFFSEMIVLEDSRGGLYGESVSVYLT